MYLSFYLSIYQSIYLSICLSICKFENENLTTSEAQQFFETSSVFERENVKNCETSLWSSWQHQKRSNSARPSSNMESWVQSWPPRTVPIIFAIFPLHLCKVLCLPRKSDARSCEVPHLSRKIWANLKIWCSKMQPLSGNQRPDLLTSLMNMSFVPRLPREMHLSRSSSNVPRLPSFLEMLQNPRVLLTFDKKVHNPLRLPRETTSERPKVLQTRQFFALTSKCASRYNGALFHHLNFQKWSETVIFLHLLLWNVLRATTACTCSSSQHPKVLREWCVLFVLTSKCASSHNGVQFFISHLASWLRTRRFSEPTFPPSGATNHWKNTVFRDFPTFSRTCVFFLLTLSFSSLIFSLVLFSSLTLPTLLFHLSILSEVWLLNFLRIISL